MTHLLLVLVTIEHALCGFAYLVIVSMVIGVNAWSRSVAARVDRLHSRLLLHSARRD